MSHKHHDGFGWMLAVDFFFAGMGAAMLVIAGLADLLLGEGMTSVLGNFVAPLCVCVGAGLLLLELPNPLKGWRVFMNPKAVICFGAYMMTLCIGAGLIYASFGLPFLPWAGFVIARKFFAVCCVIFGLIVATYPGILLGRNKARPFWTGVGMMTIFLLSSLVTGMSCFILSDLLLPAQNVDVMNVMPWLAAAVLAFQLLTWFGYMWVKLTGTTEREAIAAKMWIDGKYAMAFKGGILFIGTFIPLVLFLIAPYIVMADTLLAIGGLCVLLGGLIMRNAVIFAGQERTWLPGEQKFRGKLPHGDEDFMKILKN
ncbi:polysulfide reductase NrfD [Dehalobacter sp. DCM]|uniref:NrfD/PsrC family molybdoenzyme membrane anchor subunit n=1 Tax=Dehalobacter sp. DCM TaxID=2907827 RepID=UPI0030819BB3|nr:polysulfide reductase NrfD [Dehalobacter sp. DCM]